MAYSYVQEDGSVANCSLISSIPEGATFAEVSEFPEDRLFRGAWRLVNEQLVTDLPLAKEIAHEMRRRERAELFAPLDVQATIPSESAQAELERQAIRDADAIKQTAIDNAAGEVELRASL